jgi:hypothetical protein
MKGLLPCSTHSASQTTTFVNNRLRSRVVNLWVLFIRAGGAGSIVQVSGEANHQVSTNGEDKGGDTRPKIKGAVSNVFRASATTATNKDGFAGG